MTSDSSSASQPGALQSFFKNRDWQAADFAPLASLAVIFVFFAIVADGFLRLSTIQLVLEQGSVLAVVAMGLTFVLLCGEIDLSVGTVALLSACLCGILFEKPFAAGPDGKAEIGFITTTIVLVVPIVAALIAGLVSGLLTVSSGLPSFIITLAMMNIATGLARFLTKSKKFNVPPFLKDVGNGDIFVAGVFWPFSAAIAAVVLLIGHIVLTHTRFGRYVFMTGGNREAARLAGIRTKLIVVACLAICAVTAAMGGLMNAGRLESVSLDQNADLLLNAVACVVLGGTSLFGGEGSMGRTLLGVVTFTVLKVGLDKLKIPGIQDLDLLRPFLLGIVLMLSLVINGLVMKRGKN